jgi:hypothetical protein
MDAKRCGLEEKLCDLLNQAAAIATELQAIAQGPQTPHYDQIELPAHEVGQRLSRMIQTSRARDVAATNLAEAACPDCHQAWCGGGAQPRSPLDGWADRADRNGGSLPSLSTVFFSLSAKHSVSIRASRLPVSNARSRFSMVKCVLSSASRS